MLTSCGPAVVVVPQLKHLQYLALDLIIPWRLSPLCLDLAPPDEILLILLQQNVPLVLYRNLGGAVVAKIWIDVRAVRDHVRSLTEPLLGGPVAWAVAQKVAERRGLQQVGARSVVTAVQWLSGVARAVAHQTVLSFRRRRRRRRR